MGSDDRARSVAGGTRPPSQVSSRLRTEQRRAPEPVRVSSRPPEAEAEPTVLLVGAEKSFHTAIASALAHHGVYVETSPLNGVVDSVVATAPDLVVLVGEAAQDAGSGVLASLNSSLHTSVVPVAILADDAALAERLRAFRHGAAAVISRSASVDAMAEQMAKLAREIPDREREALGTVGEATLSELVEALSRELRTGILSVRSPRESKDDAVRVVLGGGRPLAQTIDEFVSRIRRHVVHAEPLEYEFDESAGGSVRLFGSDGTDSGADDEIQGLRILLVDQEAARADALAQALREHDASVVVTGFEPSEQRFVRLRQLDPVILLVDEHALRGAAYNLVRRMRRDTRLRWASLLVIRWEDIWSDRDESPMVERMIGTLATLAEPEQSLRKRVEVGHAFDTRLEITGPTRLLRAVVETSKAVRVTVYNPRIVVRIDIAHDLIAGVRGQLVSGGEPVEGATALAAFLVLSSGRVHIENIEEAALVNIMATVDVALNLADTETPPIQPSVPASPIDDGADGVLGMTSKAPARTSAPNWVWGLLALAALLSSAAAVAFWMPRSQKAPSVQGAASEKQVSEAPTETAAPRSPPAVPSVLNAPAAQTPAPVEDQEEDKSRGEFDPLTFALDLESRQSIATCEEFVGPSWSLLTGDQPDRAASEVQAARRALIRGDLDDAQQAFCRASVLDASNADPVSSLARLYLMRRDTQKAYEWAQKAVKSFPEDIEVQNLYGDALARIGRGDKALTAWLEAVNVDPDDSTKIHAVATTYTAGAERSLRGADFAQADRLFRRAVFLEPESLRPVIGMARALLGQGEDKAALAWAKRAAELDAKNAEVHVTLGDALEKDGDLDGAYASWRLAYELEPDNQRAGVRIKRIPVDQR